MTIEYQDAGAVNTATSKKVQYIYATGTNNNVRRTGMTYANGSALTYGYGSSSSMSDVLSRPASLIESSSSTSYTYLGWERRVRVNLPTASTMLTLIDPAGQPGGSGGDQYTGLDQFNRVSELRWVRPGVPPFVELERIQYGFDRAANRTWHDSLVATTQKQDEAYTYDGLSQLAQLARGTLDASHIITGTPAWQENWKFDSAGNCRRQRPAKRPPAQATTPASPETQWYENGTGGGAYTQRSNNVIGLDQDRTHNKANEILTFTAGTGSVWATPAYDKAGNMTVAPTPGSSSTSSTCQYDAWNRLVKVTASGGAVLGTYSYDGLDRRINKSSVSAGNHDYYYSDQWQILDDYNGSAKRHMFVWGLRYPDDLLARLTHNGTSYATRYWVLHDYLHVTAVMDTSANVQMRLGYDAYGLPRLMNANYVVTTPPTALQDWEFRFGAAYWDSETALYQMRYRYLHPRVGTWLTRDPIGNASDANLDRSFSGMPSNEADPLGLFNVTRCDYYCELTESNPSVCVYRCTLLPVQPRACPVTVRKGLLPSREYCEGPCDPDFILTDVYVDYKHHLEPH